MLLAHTAEGPVEQRQQSHRRLGDDRSSPAPGQKQADLAAEIARPQRPQDNAVLLDPSRTLEDCEQLVREVALGRDSLIHRDRDLVERLGQRCSNADGSAARQGTDSIRAGSTTARRYWARSSDAIRGTTS